MNLLEIIADVIETPEGSYQRMLDMGVPHDVIDAILAIARDKVPVNVRHLDGYTVLMFQPSV